MKGSNARQRSLLSHEFRKYELDDGIRLPKQKEYIRNDKPCSDRSSKSSMCRTRWPNNVEDEEEKDIDISNDVHGQLFSRLGWKRE